MRRARVFPKLCLGLILFSVFVPCLSWAQLDPTDPIRPSLLEAVLDSPNPSEAQDYLNLAAQIRILAFLTFLTLIPFVLIMMTSFTRITIVFHFLRQAMATQSVPSNQILIGLSLILTAFVMHPVIEEIQETALEPYFDGQLAQLPEVKLGVKGEDQIFLERCWQPLRQFMLSHTRERDMELFLDMADIQLPLIAPELPYEALQEGTGQAYDLDAIPWYVLTPAFVTTELRVAFMMGFLLFMPFLVIDMVIASVLMSMGMMMLPPVMISMPFKLLLFIVIDGWRLVIQQIVVGFYPTM